MQNPTYSGFRERCNARRLLALILRFQVSANQVPAAIETRIVPDYPSDLGGLGSA